MFNNILDNERLNFLNTKRFKKNKVCYLVISGSNSHGTNTETSDLDLRGIALHSQGEITTGKYNTKTYISPKEDTKVYYLNQIKDNLINCNVEFLELFGVRESEIILINKEGRMLRDNIYTFIGKNALEKSFGGFACKETRKARKIMTKYKKLSKDERYEEISRGINRAIFKMAEDKKWLTNNIKVHVGNCSEDTLVDVNVRGCSLVELRKLLGQMSNVIKDYQEPNYENEDKDMEKAFKHLMTATRIYMMGYDILMNKGVITYREKENEVLLNIRNGEYSNEKVFEILDFYREKFENALNYSNLPEQADMESIDKLINKINEMSLQM